MDFAAKLRWGYRLDPSELDLMPSDWLWVEFYRTENNRYAKLIASVLTARGEIKNEREL